MASFDPAANLPDRLQRRIDAWKTDPPKSQFQVYGPLNAYLQDHKFRSERFLVKPQALLREEDAGAAEDDDDVDDDAGDRSFDSQGVGVTKTKKYPDFTVCQFWGPDVNANYQSDVIRILIEVGSDEEHKWSVRRQVLTSLDFVGERFHDEILGIAIVRNKVALFRNQPNGGFYDLYGWISLFDKKFVAELNRIYDHSIRTDQTTWN